MKTRFLELFLLAIVLLTPDLVLAASACNYDEKVKLNDIVAHVNAVYVPVEIYGGKAYDMDNPNEDGSIPEVDYYIKGFNIIISNITEDIYVKVSNDKNSDVKFFGYENTTDGEISFQVEGVSNLITYTFEVYASNKYICADELLRKFTIVTPVYNNFSQLDVCTQNPDFYYCQAYIPNDSLSFQTFFDNLERYQENKQQETPNNENNKKNFIERIKEFYNNNKVTIYITVSIVIVAGVTTTVILIKKKRSRVL